MTRKPAEDPLSKLAKTMVESAQHVWLSSVSNVLRAQQDLSQQLAELLRLDVLIGSVAKMPSSGRGGDMDDEAGGKDSVQELAERAFEARVVPLLRRDDVASRAQIERLTREVEVLTRRVEALCREREGSDG